MNPTKVFIALTICTIAVIFGAGVIAATVTPTAAEQPRIQQ